MTLAQIVAVTLIGLEVAFFVWCHGYRRGMASLRREIVSSLRFKASLNSTTYASSDDVIIARGLTEAADRIERRGQR